MRENFCCIAVVQTAVVNSELLIVLHVLALYLYDDTLITTAARLLICRLTRSQYHLMEVLQQ